MKVENSHQYVCPACGEFIPVSAWPNNVICYQKEYKKGYTVYHKKCWSKWMHAILELHKDDKTDGYDL